MRYLPEGISTWEEYEEKKQKIIDILIRNIDIKEGDDYFKELLYDGLFEKMELDAVYADDCPDIFSMGQILKIDTKYPRNPLGQVSNSYEIINISKELFVELNIRHLTISFDKTTIDNDLFEYAKNLEYVVLFDALNVPDLTDHANLKQVLIFGFEDTYPDDVTTIPSFPLIQNCPLLERIEILNYKFAKLSQHTFKGSSNVKILHLECEIASVEDDIFAEMDKLEKLFVHEMKEVDGSIFDNCLNLRDVYFSGKSNLITNSGLFKNCYYLEKIALPSKPEHNANTDVCYDWLSNLPNLEDIALSIYNEDNLKSAYFKRKKKLETLILRFYCDYEGDWNFLHQMPKIRKLLIRTSHSGSKIELQGLISFYKTMRLRRSELQHKSEIRINGEGIEQLIS